jgi:cysteine synthase B
VAVYESVLDLIGNTPIVDISALSPTPRVRILAKLEGQNPGGSVKDRAAKQMVLDAERRGSSPRARGRSSSSRPRATPASPWP